MCGVCDVWVGELGRGNELRRVGCGMEWIGGTHILLGWVLGRGGHEMERLAVYAANGVGLCGNDSE